MAAESILIVDDNPANLKVARFALESEGYAVWTAADAEDAIELLKEIHPRAILMDIQLPGMDGLELTRQLKSDAATRDIVIIAVTAYAMKGDRERALRAGCDGYVTKPIDPILLPGQVGEYLARVSRGSTSSAAMDPLEIQGAAPIAGAAAVSPAPVDGGARASILLVEDNPTTRRMFRVALETAGYEVVEAHDGASALRGLDREPALVVQDLVLPDIDGLELARRIHERLGDASVPIICVSGFLSRLDEVRAQEGGFSQVLVKPVDPFDLLDAVKIHLTRPAASAEDLGRGRLLIVAEDDALERKLAQVWFTSAGFNVLVAGDGREALAVARLRRPAAILSDVLMPHMDGFALCLAVRQDPELAGIPVVLASSAYAEGADQDLARRVGASALLPKAGGLDPIARAIASALGAPLQPVPSEPVESIEREHGARALAQLDRQVLENSSLIRRSRLQQAQLAVLAGIADSLAKNAFVDHVLRDALASTLDMAGVSKGALYLAGADEALSLSHQIGFSESESVRLRTVLAQTSLLADVAKRGRAVAVPSPGMDADEAQRLLIDAGVTSLLLVPLVSGVKTYGMMLLGARNADVAGEDALAFARVLGSQMGQAVSLAEAFDRLQASERRYRTLNDHAHDGIAILTPDGIIREVNRRFAELLGYPAERFVGAHVSEFAPPGAADAMAAEYRSAIKKGRGSSLVVVRKSDGDTLLIEMSVAPVDIEGEPLVFSIGRDVTEAHHHAQLLALSSAIGVALTAGDSLHQTLQQCAEAIVSNLDAAFARIWTLEDREGVLELQASAGLYTHLDGPHGRVRLGDLKIGRIAQSRRPHLTNDVVGDPEIGDQEWARREGIVAFAGHPLIVAGKVVGVTALFARRPLPATVLAGLASVADQIALGIERHRGIIALRDAEERMRFALESANVGIFDLDCASGVLRWNSTREAQYGLQPGTFAGTFDAFVDLVHPEDRAEVRQAFERALKAGPGYSLLHRAIRPDGTVRWIRGVGRMHFGPDGQPQRVTGISLDVTEQRLLEQQLHLSQKMEAIGQLAGGIAHDFNNLLTAILGFSNFVIEELTDDDPRRADMAEVIKAGQRATTLTKQLLAFSRKQVLQPIALDLNALVAGVRQMLARLIGEHIDLATALADDLRIVRADPGQIEQIIVNLVVNARDAMPDGGRISIETANVNLDNSYAIGHHPVTPGAYVMLAMSDTGTGMTDEVKRRVFEPFFTTKAQGKGTGLGLATVYGIVKQSGGYIWVYSEPGGGTSFKVYLPVAESAHEAASEATVAETAVNGTETVLVVEDEGPVRHIAKVILERAGYRVVDAANPREAEGIFLQDPRRFDLLVTDVVMPESSGPRLFDRLAAIRPDLKVLYVSGYTGEAIVHQGQLDPGVKFLQKPFTAADLTRRVREAIDT